MGRVQSKENTAELPFVCSSAEKLKPFTNSTFGGSRRNNVTTTHESSRGGNLKEIEYIYISDNESNPAEIQPYQTVEQDVPHLENSSNEMDIDMSDFKTLMKSLNEPTVAQKATTAPLPIYKIRRCSKSGFKLISKRRRKTPLTFAQRGVRAMGLNIKDPLAQRNPDVEKTNRAGVLKSSYSSVNTSLRALLQMQPAPKELSLKERSDHLSKVLSNCARTTRQECNHHTFPTQGGQQIRAIIQDENAAPCTANNLPLNKWHCDVRINSLNRKPLGDITNLVIQTRDNYASSAHIAHTSSKLSEHCAESKLQAAHGVKPISQTFNKDVYKQPPQQQPMCCQQEMYESMNSSRPCHCQPIPWKSVSIEHAETREILHSSNQFAYSDEEPDQCSQDEDGYKTSPRTLPSKDLTEGSTSTNSSEQQFSPGRFAGLSETPLQTSETSFPLPGLKMFSSHLAHSIFADARESTNNQVQKENFHSNLPNSTMNCDYISSNELLNQITLDSYDLTDVFLSRIL